MDCKKVVELLSLLLDDEVPARERAPLDQHLQVCPDCSRQLEHFRVMQGALADMPAIEAPGQFLVDVRARIDQPVTLAEQLEPLFETLSRGPVLAGATLAALLGLTHFSGALGPAGPVQPDLLPGAEAPALTVASASDLTGLAGAASLPGEASAVEVPGADPGANPTEAGSGGAALAATDGDPSPALAAAPTMLAAAPAAVVAPASATRADGRAPGQAPGAPSDPGSTLGQADEPPATRAPAPSADRPPSDLPFLDGGVALADARAAAPRPIEDMGADELSAELGRMLPSGDGPGSLAIFDPGSADVRARLSPEEAAGPRSAPSVAPVRTAPAPRATVSLAWLRTHFGRKVQVRDAGSDQPQVDVARQVDVSAAAPKGFLEGVRNLTQAGWGMDLEEVLFWDGGDVEVVISFGTEASASARISRFVEDLRALAGGELASDVSLGATPGQPSRLRLVMENGATIAATSASR